MGVFVTMRIGLFGGTFDPVHSGHLEMARIARITCHLDRIVFIPCQQSPFKSRATVASGKDRSEMLRLALRDKGFHHWAEVSELELERPGPSYSWETVQAMALEYPGARLFWIMGGDQWLSLGNWARADYLADHLEFIVFARDNVPLVAHYRFRGQLIPFDRPESATLIRQGKWDQDWLTPATVQYIQEHRLYPSFS